MTSIGGDAHQATADWLASGAAGGALSAAEAAVAASPRDPLAASTALRRAHPDLLPDRAAATLEQATLRRLARERYGLDPTTLLLTRDGLEQATRPEVAAQRAEVLRASGVEHVVDLTAGLGFDTAAFLASGLSVTAVERDPVTALLLAHNCPSATVLTADAHDVAPGLLAGLAPTDAVFVDPARRDPDGPRDRTLRARPERDPGRWSPPWSFIESLPHPRIVAKVTASFTPPPGWFAQWTSVDRSLVECAVYSWPALESARCAAVFFRSHLTVLPGHDADPTPAAGPGHALEAWLHEPDPAVLRAGAVPALMRIHPALRSLGDPSTWLTSAAPVEAGPLVRSFEVIEELRGTVREQRRQLDRLGVTTLTVKSRDAAVAPADALRDLGRREGDGHVLVVTRRSGRAVRVLCRAALLPPAG